MEEQRFDDLSRLIATKTSRRQMLKVLVGATVGGVFLRMAPTRAFASNSTCAHFRNQVFGKGTVAQSQCASEGARHGGLCYSACGPVGSGGTLCGATSGGYYTSYSDTTCCASGTSTCLGTTCCANTLVCGSNCLAAACDTNQCLACDPTSGTCASTCTSGTTCASGTCCPDARVCGYPATCCASGDTCHGRYYYDYYLYYGHGHYYIGYAYGVCLGPTFIANAGSRSLHVRQPQTARPTPANRARRAM